MSVVQDIDHGIVHLSADEKHLSLLAAAVIAARFQSLATTEWLITDRFQRGGIMLKNVGMWAEHALVHGEVHIATTMPLPDGRVRKTEVPQAAAIWLHYDEPDTSPVPLPDRYHERIAEDYGEYVDNVAELDELFDKHHPLDRGPHQSLVFLASMQDGSGQGTALLRHHLEVLDRRALGAHLVAADERSRDLYARHGFEMLDQVLELPSRHGTGPAHVMYPMWRNPLPPPPDEAGNSQA